MSEIGAATAAAAALAVRGEVAAAECGRVGVTALLLVLCLHARGRGPE